MRLKCYKFAAEHCAEVLRLNVCSRTEHRTNPLSVFYARRTPETFHPSDQSIKMRITGRVREMNRMIEEGSSTGAGLIETGSVRTGQHVARVYI